ncbi:MAG: glycine--tRNA ligase subunit beta [Alphaproteobacteria bacterium]
MAQLLLEILSEEIPARMQARAAEDLKRMVTEGLVKNGLEPKDPRAFVTPRRLTMTVHELPTAQPDVSEERRGPRVDAPEPAIQGFLKANGITLDQAEKRTTPKGDFYFAVIHKKGRATADVIRDVIEEVMAGFPWPKSMRWGAAGATRLGAAGATRWVRPIQSILCAFNKEVVPVRFAGVEAGDMTEGHRFLGPITFPVRGFTCYERGLREAFVLLDPEERSRVIASGAADLAAAEGLTVKPDGGLLAEVIGLVEWPVVLMGRIDDAFMDVPAEVLTTAMRTHQKYFSLLRADGSLAPRFIVVSNMVTKDDGRAIVAGNERVLRARLSDAKFFWDQDRRHTLESRLPTLGGRIFHARLGTMADKVERVRKLGVALTEFLPDTPSGLVERAALLCKADLSSGMVGEFPELQGIMGRYYARHDGEPEAVADAIAEHYSPLGPNDACPTRPVSVIVALADKIDTLVGFWAIDEKPTGSKDPFALRRAALGVIRLIIENGLRLNLLKVFRSAMMGLRVQNHAGVVAGMRTRAEAMGIVGTPPASFYEFPDLLDFFADRLKVHLREQGVRHDLVSAVFALGGEDDLVRLLARVEALGRFLGTDDGANLLVAYRRAANIVRIEEKKDGTSHGGAVDAGLLRQDEERTLLTALETVERDCTAAVTNERFDGAMGALARLRPPVDAFFDRVTVNCGEPELRSNRLRLLSRIGAAMGGIADFSRIEG